MYRSSLLALVLLLAGCAALGEDLRRAERAFGDAHYEDVRVWLHDLAPHVAELNPTQRARYYYMAGVTAYRLGDLRAARHNLLLCREEATAPGAQLSEDRARNLALTLAELE